MIFLRKQLEALCSTFSVNVHDAILLLQHVLNRSYNSLFFEKEFEIEIEQIKKFKEYMRLRGNGMPIAKIIGYKFFYNHKFKTTVDTLDPRPETEIIIDLFLKYFPEQLASLSILDLGCGTGCIGLSILDLYPNITAYFVDISDKVIDVANTNAKNLKLANRCTFIKSDWFEFLKSKQLDDIPNKFDAIVCNPPYIEKNYKLSRDTLYDPHIALFGGKDGLDAYKRILPNVCKFLCPNGKLFLEFGIGQCNDVCSIAEQWSLKVLEVAKDLQGIERTAVFINLSSH